MWKYNKYNLGDIISHNEAPGLEFQIREILRGEPDEKNNYMYYCYLIFGDEDEIGNQFNYIETDISLVRKGTKPELEEFLNDLTEKEDYEIAQEVKKLIDSL